MKKRVFFQMNSGLERAKLTLSAFPLLLKKGDTFNGIAILIASTRKEPAALAQVLKPLRKFKFVQ